MRKHSLWLTLIVLAISANTSHAQSSNGALDDAGNAPAFTRQLGNSDPYERQRAAESLARVSAVDQKRLVEGYYLQEKNRKVRLALEWALYRMGKPETLFRIVNDLDSSRHDQAVGYLAQVEGPELLYPFLQRQDNSRRVTAGLIEALGYLGDADSLERIKPYRESYAPGVAEAARGAIEKIQSRLAETPPPRATRPRVVGKDQPQPD